MIRLDGTHSIPLDAFRKVEGQEGKVDIVQGNDGQPQVIATGRSSTGREVQWLRPGSEDVHTSQVVERFLESVSEEFGPRITSSIARELGLERTSGGLDTRTVERAVHMAETEREVFSGINFFLELHCSAEARTPAFRAACTELGINPDTLGRDTLKSLDQRFHAALAEASSSNNEPLPPEQGERLLRQVLDGWVRDGRPAGGSGQ
ncbi:BspR family type III secretion system anti-sigma factor [Pseudothauera rhizosphaerae]|uniref:Uncharacterized protein n=1 Tax=Pseudothauera rhizosphaerae TaxID=2565932 RepID=A0A4S4AE09_9RHOO|nr:hypothetical protein [Pseudothauera rhizosphaerae]THF57257.1 hypothetical protein E6O51_18345 [Pseudothauera rhizosphaerae]